VLLVTVLVAVAATTCPGKTVTGTVWLKLALPDASVVTLVEPMNVWPSPNPDAFGNWLEKNSILNVELELLLSVPWMFVLVPAKFATVNSGKF